MNNLINWSEVSRLLTSDRTSIRSDYNGKKYKRKVDRLKRLVDLWVRWQEKKKIILHLTLKCKKSLRYE